MRLEVEHAVGNESIYCPYKDCSELLVKPDVIEPDVRTTCPTCTRTFCLNCQIEGWHEVGVDLHCHQVNPYTSVLTYA